MKLEQLQEKIFTDKSIEVDWMDIRENFNGETEQARWEDMVSWSTEKEILISATFHALPQEEIRASIKMRISPPYAESPIRC